MFIEGRKHDPRAKNGSSWNRVSPDFFTTMGIPLLRGRSITEQDTPASPAVAVVNQAFVKRFFPNEDPIGRHFGKGDETHAGDFEIVGVVGDVKYQSQTEPPYPMAFVPLLQRHHYKTMNDEVTENRSVFISNFILHVDGKPAGLEEQVRRTLAGISPDLALLHFASYDEQIGDNLNQEKLLSRLTSLFSGLALLLASVGLYGVTSYRVARRTGEIGIRMALGANPRDVMMMVLRGAFSQIGLGLLIGIPLALGAGRLLASKLFGVHGYDPIVLGGAVAVLGICALLASAAPARRAATVQPMQALRSD
jgi:predicted permease